MAGWNDTELWIGPADGSAPFRDVWAIVPSQLLGRLADVQPRREPPRRRLRRRDGARLAVLQLGDDDARPDAPRAEHRNAQISSIAFDPAVTRLALGSGDGVVYVWDLGRQSCSRSCAGSAGAVRTVAFSPDGEWLLAGYENRVATLWRASGDQTDSLTFAGHDSAVIAGGVSRDGLKVLTTSEDKALIWTLRSAMRGDAVPRRVWEIVGGPRTLVHGGKLVAAAFSADGGKVITAARDGTARVWWSQSQEPRVLGVHGARVESLAFNGDATRVISASDDGTARIWAIDGRTAPVCSKATSAAIGYAARCSGPATIGRSSPRPTTRR